MTTNRYTHEWFKDRALRSLKKIGDGLWDYSDSLLIYVPSGAETYESLQQTDTPYHRLVTKPERAYLESVAERMASLLPDSFDYIDLGPGTEHKEQFLFDALRAQGKTFTYMPVDISDHFLDVAEAHACTQGIPVKRLKSSFEELPERLGPANRPRFVSLGLTFSNYEAPVIIDLLKRIAGANGYAFVNAQIRERVDMDALQSVYQEEMTKTFDGKLRLLGLNPEEHPIWIDDGFRGWCTVDTMTAELEGVDVQPNDELLVFMSLRYSKASLEQTFAGIDAEFLDTGTPFIGAMIRS